MVQLYDKLSSMIKLSINDLELHETYIRNKRRKKQWKNLALWKIGNLSPLFGILVISEDTRYTLSFVKDHTDGLKFE